MTRAASALARPRDASSAYVAAGAIIVGNRIAELIAAVITMEISAAKRHDATWRRAITSLDCQS